MIHSLCAGKASATPRKWDFSPANELRAGTGGVETPHPKAVSIPFNCALPFKNPLEKRWEYFILMPFQRLMR
jgi:hypothetical protein